ncbi:hypothetical protein F2Q68_00016595 [Brassica cretica]|uniref:Uncharacterized protein n=1 Tax=Brassica cretica TaxID=69181 RepID=A0A8S9HR33_BRACR|nr:hypothetical protein F2Q68_00016595 [Brassica cretica]
MKNKKLTFLKPQMKKTLPTCLKSCWRIKKGEGLRWKDNLILFTKIYANGKALSSRLDGVIAHVKSFNNNISHMIEDQEESIIPLYNINTYEEHTMDMEIDVEEDVQIKDGFQQEAEDSIHELEVLLGCMVDEKLVIRYEEQVEPIAFMGYQQGAMMKK